MGNHELMITEMVLQCILADKQPSEIAALLSCLVFQQRTSDEPVITDTLKEVIHINFCMYLKQNVLNQSGLCHNEYKTIKVFIMPIFFFFLHVHLNKTDNAERKHLKVK